MRNILRYGIICVKFIREYIPPRREPNTIPIRDMQKYIELINDCYTYANKGEYDRCIAILLNMMNTMGDDENIWRIENVLSSFENGDSDAPEWVESLGISFGDDDWLIPDPVIRLIIIIIIIIFIVIIVVVVCVTWCLSRTIAWRRRCDRHF